ncbi:MAG: site-specific DNA-methyltransferase [Treponematales bacterium]
MRTETYGPCTYIQGDYMDYMKTLPDKAFDLAIVDPPYGIGKDKQQWQTKNRGARTSSRVWLEKDWDKKPEQNYFDELKRVSLNQIVFGGNYFIGKLKDSHSCWIVWDKMNIGQFSCADAELAWTSFDTRCRIFQYCWIGYSQGIPGRSTPKNKEIRIHPTQKPVPLYKWLLEKYAKPGMKIMDTHGGSFSSGIAALEMGFEYTGIELDEDYFNMAVARMREAWESTVKSQARDADPFRRHP